MSKQLEKFSLSRAWNPKGFSRRLSASAFARRARSRSFRERKQRKRRGKKREDRKRERNDRISARAATDRSFMRETRVAVAGVNCVAQSAHVRVKREPVKRERRTVPHVTLQRCAQLDARERMNAPLIYIGNGTALLYYSTSDWTPDWSLEFFLSFFSIRLYCCTEIALLSLLLMPTTVLALPHV